MVAYTEKDKKYIFRNDIRNFSVNPQGKEVALFTYGNGRVEKFNKEVYESLEILKFTADEYASIIYSLSSMIEKVSDDSFKNIVKSLEKEIEYYFKNQLSYVIENQLPFIRHKMMESIGIRQNFKEQFIITF